MWQRKVWKGGAVCFKSGKKHWSRRNRPHHPDKEGCSCPGRRSGVKRHVCETAPARSANTPDVNEDSQRRVDVLVLLKWVTNSKCSVSFDACRQKWGLREIHLSRVPWHNYVLRLISHVRRLSAVNEQTTPLFLAIIISIRTSSVVAEMPCGPVEILNRF